MRFSWPWSSPNPPTSGFLSSLVRMNLGNLRETPLEGSTMPVAALCTGEMDRSAAFTSQTWNGILQSKKQLSSKDECLVVEIRLSVGGSQLVMYLYWLEPMVGRVGLVVGVISFRLVDYLVLEKGCMPKNVIILINKEIFKMRSVLLEITLNAREKLTWPNLRQWIQFQSCRLTDTLHSRARSRPTGIHRT